MRSGHSCFTLPLCWCLCRQSKQHHCVRAREHVFLCLCALKIVRQASAVAVAPASGATATVLAG